MTTRLRSLVFLTLWLAAVGSARAQGTAFTYQGQLKDGANPASGIYELCFALFDASSAGNQAGPSLTNAPVSVSNGLFTVTLDFGASFPGADRWLEIGVRTNGGGAFAALTPRQKLTPVPYAIHAADASAINGASSASFAPASGSTAYVAKSGDTMTGPLNVGLSLASPTPPLRVDGYDGFGTIASFERGLAGEKKLWLRSLATERFVFMTDGAFTFETGGTDNSNGNEVLRIQPDGKVGLGTASPSAKLHVGGGTRFTSADIGSIFLQSGTGGSGAARDWKMYVPMPVGNLAFRDMGFDNLNNGMAYDAFVIQYGTGNVGIGKNNPATTLDVNGTVTATAFIGNGAGLNNIPASAITESDPIWSAASSGIQAQINAKADSNLVWSTFATVASLTAEQAARAGADTALSNSVASKLDSNVWATADSTTNYVRRTGDTMSGVLSNSLGLTVAGVGQPMLSLVFPDANLAAAGYSNAFTVDGVGWTAATTNAAWQARQGFSTLIFNNQFWVLGGYGTNVLNDVWSSTNGIDWVLATNAAAWSARQNPQAVVFNNRMWVIGGFNGAINLNDVWSSTNGADWVLATNAAAFPGRYSHQTLVYNNRMWVLGGIAVGNVVTNDVWSSTNGSDWVIATAVADWSKRYGHFSMVHSNKMWVMGGISSGNKNDVWSSSNGINWTLAVGTATWSARAYAGTLEFDNKMWVLGGYDGASKNDVYSSADGVLWSLVTSTAPWPVRYAHTTAVFNGRMWVLGGAGTTSYRNDVWSTVVNPEKLGRWYIYSRGF